MAGLLGRMGGRSSRRHPEGTDEGRRLFVFGGKLILGLLHHFDVKWWRSLDYIMSIDRRKTTTITNIIIIIPRKYQLVHWLKVQIARKQIFEFESIESRCQLTFELV
jgi:hypothetical protein